MNSKMEIKFVAKLGMEKIEENYLIQLLLCHDTQAMELMM